MKYWLFPTLAVVLAVAGCSPQAGQNVSQSPVAETQAAQTQTQPVKLTAEQELTKFCRVCVLDDGEKIEEYFPSRLDTKYEGKTYKLCSDDCKKKFDANPNRYALKS